MHLYLTKYTDTREVMKNLTTFIDEWGLPDRLISVPGTCITSTGFQEFCTSTGIQQILNSSRHPQANGQVERVNRILISLLSIQYLQIKS